MHFGASCAEPGLDQVLSNCHPVRRLSANFNIAKDENADVIEGAKDTWATGRPPVDCDRPKVEFCRAHRLKTLKLAFPFRASEYH
jgi:hypothetical protein